jgi:CheY-like chemotaxis protein
MGSVIRSIDWARTPLGPIDSWPQGLRASVSVCLNSKFPISLVWGPQHTQIYNDGYWPICGGKHPTSMGQDFSECWASAWPAIGTAFARAFGGETSFLENQRMFLDRNGYLEETFFTFSFSPIRDETGSVVGLFHPVTETTARMLSERRARTLRDLAARTREARTAEEAFAIAAQSLSESRQDLPFVLFFDLDERATRARLVAHTGVTAAGAAMLATMGVEGRCHAHWPALADLIRSRTATVVEGLEAWFTACHEGPYPECPGSALALPIRPPGRDDPIALLIAGVSARLPLTDLYRAFVETMAASIASAAAHASLRTDCDETAAQARPGPALAATDTSTRARPPCARVLLADDDPDIRDYVSRLLAQDYDVMAVPNGALALAAARRTAPDLVLSDVVMPDLDGFGLVRALRLDERTRAVPVILMSGCTGEEFPSEGLDAGADDYLFKPFSARELLVRVRAHLRRARIR